jgi:rare lipoprotein A
MSSGRRRWLLLAGSLLAACAERTPPPRTTIQEIPSRPSGPVQEGKASWYGREQQGGPTASGERFDMHQLTAAHRTLRMGLRVRVTNLRNGRSVVVRINDRGPYGRGRIIDVSYAAAIALDMIDAGVVPARVEVLP